MQCFVETPFLELAAAIGNGTIFTSFLKRPKNGDKPRPIRIWFARNAGASFSPALGTMSRVATAGIAVGNWIKSANVNGCGKDLLLSKKAGKIRPFSFSSFMPSFLSPAAIEKKSTLTKADGTSL
ncbi:hypothetical protein [Pseudodesulfovibrio tunisiensis]|uniref:hypothetical protein n=1 Tax=Pseudodesulfovibrio tunisiensis TaxID=463192 RepID=UPI001FB34EDA|nr:hypothetical protein [Pseudodesulfovibrio tunisiensis]